MGDAAAGPWPGWARPQLAAAVAIAERAPDHLGIARLLYREWFSPLLGAAAAPTARPMVGVFRAAHAGSGRRLRTGSVSVVDRFDLLGPDGWWRTWGTEWTPPRSRRGSVRLMLSPRVDRLPDLVRTEAYRVDVETTSELTRGRTVVDLRRLTGKPPNVDVGVAIDRERFIDVLIDAVGSIGSAD